MRPTPIAALPRKRSQMSNLPSADAVAAYSHYLIMKAQLAGNLTFDGHKPSAEEKEVANQCRELCERITRRLSICKEADIPTLFGCYDTLYRIGNKRPPDSGYVMRIKNRVIDAWKAGNRDIEESSVFGLIALDVKYRAEMVNDSWTTVYQSILDKWVRTLHRHNSFPDVSSYENYQRLALIMRENISDYFDDPKEIKLRWYKHNRVDDLSSMTTRILRSYRTFVSSTPYGLLTHDEKTILDHRILTELSTRKDLDPYDREAFRLGLQFNQGIA